MVDDLIVDLNVVSHLPSYMSAMPPQDLQHITNAFGGGQNGREVQTQLNEHFDLERKLESAGGGEVAAEDVADHTCHAALCWTPFVLLATAKHTNPRSQEVRGFETFRTSWEFFEACYMTAATPLLKTM